MTVFFWFGFVGVLGVVIVKMGGRIEGFLHYVIPECCYRKSMCVGGFLLGACRNDGVFLGFGFIAVLGVVVVRMGG